MMFKYLLEIMIASGAKITLLKKKYLFLKKLIITSFFTQSNNLFWH